MRRTALAFLAAFLGLAAGCGGAADGPSVERPQRIILLSMDTVRADRVSGYGPLDTTPVLADIAAEGLLFRNSYGASTAWRMPKFNSYGFWFR